MKGLRYIKLLILINIIILVSVSSVFSQDCQRFHHHGDCWTKDKKKDYQQYGQARSAVLVINKKFTYQAIFYSKKDFKVFVCTEQGYYPVHYRLIEAKTNEVFYDNAEDDYVEHIGFTTEKNLTLNIEVTILAEDILPEDGKDLRVCAGIQIVWRKVPKTGF